jgi:2-hydroxychromene-2-carboxylate isomerase
MFCIGLTFSDKDKWINTERMRWAKYFNIPISKDSPPGFPINTLPIQRALASLSISHPQSVASAISLFYENTWVQWGEPTKPENLLAILRTIVGSDDEAKKVLERTKSDEVKKVLAQNTDQAFKDGAFGLPYFVGESPICQGGMSNHIGSLLIVHSYKCKGRDRRLLGRRPFGTTH